MVQRSSVLILFVFSAALLQAQTPRLSLAPVLSGLSQPVFLTNARDGTNRRFIVEQAGRIRVLLPEAATPALFLDITSRVLFGGERGLLGLAFHPQFGANGRLYVNYTRRPDGATVVAEYRDGVEQRVLFTVAQPYENHNGGMIEFGPDGYLYIGMGDGGSGNDPGNRAQNLNELLGKMLRINVDVLNSQPEIFAYGFRNPWRFSFDRATGQLYAGDVGQSSREEIDIVTRGGNYGWRVWEGTLCTGLGPAPCSAPGFIPPIADYQNTGPSGRCSIIGGYVYRGTQASLPYGAYVYGDLCSGEILMLKDGVQTVLLDTTLQISSFGEDEAGEIYVVNINGSIFKLTNPDVVTASQRSFATAERQAFAVSTAGSAGGLTVGYARIQPAAAQPVPSGLAIFALRQQGVLVSEASVPASPAIGAGRLFAEVGGAVNTGVALANPNGQDATVSFYFTDSNGTNFGQGTTTIPANRQISAFLNQPPFNGGDTLAGTFTFSASPPIAAIALRGFTNERGEFLITTLPIMEIGGSSSATTTIPHFADGGGWTTQVVLVNPLDSALSGTAQFLGPGGDVIQTSPYTIAPRSSARVVTAGSGGSTRTGSVRIPPGPGALAIFSYKPGGVTVTEGGVPVLPPATALQVYVDSPGAIQSGLAIANPSTAPADVTLEISGASAGLSIPPGGQRAMFLSEIPGLAGLQGVLRITSATPIAVIGVRGRANERGEFLITTAMPVDETAASTASELVFPHFAEGGGYSMQFILFGRGTSGTLYFLNQSGTAVNLLFR